MKLSRPAAHFVLRCLAFVCLTGSCQGEDLAVLFLGDDGPHQPQARFAELEPVLAVRGIRLNYTDRTSDLNAEHLQQFKAVVVYANIDSIEKQNADALIDYVASGGGFVPLHCATYSFRNSPELVALMGAQFQKHGTGVFRAQIAAPEHELMRGYGGFESWDETYVHHLHNEENRTVLEYRVDAEGREPWTWIRTHDNGRVFYTAWGHDSRTWTNPGFHNLVERGIRWSAGSDPQDAGLYLDDMPFPVADMRSLAQDLKPFEYEDVGKQIPNYTPSKDWGTQGEPLNMMQKPLEPTQSLKHLSVPEGFHVELFASEPDLAGKPICMAWDERGRLWVAETYDYPNELQSSGKGRDRIRICEDTDGDGKADKFIVFAESLSIPTSIAFSRGGVIVQNGIETLFLHDTDGDDKADQRDVLISNWQLGDTHGGVSNFQYGLDNWIWAMQGYNASQPLAAGKEQQQFRMGFFRMRPDGSEIEFVRSTNNNTWGLGISEEGLIFGSTANGNPSVYMPIANRYYERVRGWTPSLTLSSIADTNDFAPMTNKVRQVDHHGGYTAAAGHAIYTAREYPSEYWNRVAFVNGPTGHLVGSFVLKGKGSDFSSSSPFNLLASDDEWTAPIMSEVGPDGQVWMIDWYNYIVQHNPTPQGFETGKGRAYETKLRDKKHGRIYRIVADSSVRKPIPDLAKASPQELVRALKHPTMLVRKHAQRLLVERGNRDVAESLFALVRDEQLDEIGLNVGAIHAFWTLHGLGLLDGSNTAANDVAFAALKHSSAGVRRNALQVLPPISTSVDAIRDAGSLRDRNAQVRLAALLALSDLPANDDGGQLVLSVVTNANEMADKWIPDAATSAAARNSSEFLRSLTSAGELTSRATDLVSVVATHYARSEESRNAPALLASISEANPGVLDAVIQGLANGPRNGEKPQLSRETEANLEKLLDRASPRSRGTLVMLATNWGSQRFAKYGKEIADRYLTRIRDAKLSDEERVGAAMQLIEFLPDDAGVVTTLMDEVHPRTPPAVAIGLIESLNASRSAAVGREIVDRLPGMTPSLRKSAIVQLLRRPGLTLSLLDAVEKGQASLGDLALDQKQALAAHTDQNIKRRAIELLEEGGSLPDADRQKVLTELSYVTKQKGDAVKGKEVFKTHCSKCHLHSGEGTQVGPDLTGVAVHPREELLIHILDPSRNVEGNFRSYSVLTLDGITINGMLASESKSAIELFDTEGKKQSVLREDIEEFQTSAKSIMPEGFEKSATPDELTNLLEFLTTRGRFVPLDISTAATLPSDRGMFTAADMPVERLVFDDWSPKTFAGVPFHLIDPKDGTVANTILLHGPNGAITRNMPRSVAVPCNGSATTIHLLSGVGGWAHPYGNKDAVAMTVRLFYGDGQTEDHDLINGQHFADYIRRVDVPKSEFAFDLSGRQIRYLAISPKRTETLSKIEFVKGPDVSAPVVMAVTVETAGK